MPTPESHTPKLPNIKDRARYRDGFAPEDILVLASDAMQWQVAFEKAELELEQAKKDFEIIEIAYLHRLENSHDGSVVQTNIGKERDELKQQVETLTKQLNQWSNAEILGETERCELQRLRHQLLTSSAHNAKLREALRCANNSYVGSPDGQKQIDTALALPHDQVFG